MIRLSSIDPGVLKVLFVCIAVVAVVYLLIGQPAPDVVVADARGVPDEESSGTSLTVVKSGEVGPHPLRSKYA